MDNVALLIKVYYEALYELLENNRHLLVRSVDDLLRQELAARCSVPFDDDKISAYLEAAVAFIDERIELYNPFGLQYLYDRGDAQAAAEMELKLNWYDSSDEFSELIEAARQIVNDMDVQQDFQKGASQLIKQQGAFPDQSIISAYQAAPALNKLPDYVVACAIEKII
jgi:hypothetical protein